MRRIYNPITKQRKRIEDELCEKSVDHKTTDLKNQILVKISEPQFSSTPDNRVFPSKKSQEKSFLPYGRMSTIMKPSHFHHKLNFNKPKKPGLKRELLHFLPTRDIAVSKYTDDNDGDNENHNDSVFIDGDND